MAIFREKITGLGNENSPNYIIPSSFGDRRNFCEIHVSTLDSSDNFSSNFGVNKSRKAGK